MDLQLNTSLRATFGGLFSRNYRFSSKWRPNKVHGELPTSSWVLPGSRRVSEKTKVAV